MRIDRRQILQILAMGVATVGFGLPRTSGVGLFFW